MSTHLAAWLLTPSIIDTKLIHGGDSLHGNRSLYTPSLKTPTSTSNIVAAILPIVKGIYNVAFSQALRLQKICSRPTDYERHVEELKGYLINWGYDGEEVELQIEKDTRNGREELLMSLGKKKEQVTLLAVMIYPDLPHLKHILHDHQCIINTSP